VTAGHTDEWALDPHLVHLNHGSFGACPRTVLASQDRWRHRLERDPTGFFEHVYPGALDLARTRLAGFVGADPTGVVFVTNATVGTNAVLLSIAPGLRAGDEILVTDHTYNATRNAVEATCASTGASTVTARIPFPLASADAAIEAVLARVGPRTRLAVIDHVTSPTALVLPVERLVSALEPEVPVLVDGAHAPGMVPLDLDRLGASYTVGNCHKWLGAPKGAGFLHVRADRRADVAPTVVSHGWNGRWHGSSSRFHALFDWPGTFDPSPWLSVPTAIEVMGRMHPDGWPGLMAANHRLAIEGSRIVGTAVGDPGPPTAHEMIGSMAAVPLPTAHGGAESQPAQGLARWLREERGIVIAASAWPEPSSVMVRVSAQRYNTVADYERLTAALRVWQGAGR
jgi:isopenicillin-N epimerase